MGGGSWTTASYVTYASNTRGANLTATGVLDCNFASAQDMFTSRNIAPELNPKGVIRECCDSDEHPNTIPVILAIDVTGSMGSAAMEVAKKINVVMTELYNKVTDVEFLVMGIGDLAYDRAPIQASQFESDIRIAEQLDKVYFEGGGGGNGYESYTAAWYFGLRHTKLDCWNRGKKGIIITMGDEPLNPYMPYIQLSNVCGDGLECNVETADLYKEVVEKFDVYHLHVEHGHYYAYSFDRHIATTFGTLLDSKHLRKVNVDNIANEIIDIVVNASQDNVAQVAVNSNGEISW